MQRVVIAVNKPWEVIPKYQESSIMVINPSTTKARYQYLLEQSDYSILHTDDGIEYRAGGSYPNEKIYWYTSGTTGDSKFYSFSQSQLDKMCDNIIRSYKITAEDRYHSIMPLWHAHGQGFYWATLKAGTQCTYGTVQDLKQLEQIQPTFITAVPRILRAILKLNLTKLRFIRSASAPLPNDLWHSLKDRFKVPVLEAFGMTEACSHCFTNPLLGTQKIGTIGLPDGIEARIDEEKHLWIKGPSVYLPNKWVDTGDIASVDVDGYFSIIGRSVDQININGIKINPRSIESQCLAFFPQIEQMVVYGTDTVNVAYVGNVPEDQIISWFRSLGPHCYLKTCKSLDNIPTNDLGKIDRKSLMQLS